MAGKTFNVLRGSPNNQIKRLLLLFKRPLFIGMRGYVVWSVFLLKKSCHHLWPPPRVTYTRITPLKCPLHINKNLLRKHFFNKQITILQIFNVKINYNIIGNVINPKTITEFSKLYYKIRRIRFQNFKKWIRKLIEMDWDFHWIVDQEMKIKSGLFQKWIYIFSKLEKKKCSKRLKNAQNSI
jgi:hypothetical protein